MNRWTIKQLEEMDDITFAMCILSERRETLNQEAPLAKKLKGAYRALDDLRGGAPIPPGERFHSLREFAYRAVAKRNKMDDIEGYLENETETTDLAGLTPGEVAADKEMMEQIFGIFDKFGCSEDYWIQLEHSIEEGIKRVLESRKSA